MAEVNPVPTSTFGDLGNLMGTSPTAQLQQAQTSQAQATAGLVQQQAVGAGLQNQMTAITQSLFRSGLNGLLTGVDASKADSSGTQGPESIKPTSIFDTAAVDAGLRQRWYVDPAGTPAQQKQLQVAQLSQQPGLIGLAQTQIDQGVKSQTAQNQRDSAIMYDQLASVVAAKDQGVSPFETLKAVNPAAAAQIAQSTDDPETRDNAAYELANHVAASVHQYTGRPVEADNANVYRDKVTGLPVAGLPQAGLSTAQWMDAAKDAYSLVPVNNADGSTSQVPKYMSPGQPGGGNAAAYIKAMLASTTKAAGLSPTISGAPAAQANAAANAAAKLGAKNAPVTSSSDPTLNKALSDSSYRLTSQPDLPVPKAGTTPNTEQAGAQHDVASARSATFKDTQAILGPQQQALTFYRAAQDILDSKGAKTSAYAPIIAEAKRWIPGFDALDTSNYQELAKYLSNAAIQSASAVFPKMTDSAKKLALNVLNPSASMNDTATRNMISTNMKNSQYLIDTANRFKTYNMAGNDPRSFYDWNRQYFPQEKAVVQDGKSMPTGAKFQAYATTHFGGDTTKAAAFLQAQGYK